MDVPEFSAIIPSYNHAPYLGEAIESALAQEEVEFEVVVIDDGSTDASREVIEQYRDEPRLRAYFQENQGVSPTFNRGLELARGKYVGYVCSDDVWEPNHLRTAKEAFEAAEPDCLFVFGEARIIDEEGAAVGPETFDMFRPPEPDRELFDQLCYGNFIPFISVVSRRDAVQDVGGFDDEIGIMQDYDLWLRLLLRGTSRYHGQSTVRFRWHGENESGHHARGSIQRRLDRIRILERLFELAPERIEGAGLDADLRQILSQNYSRLARRLEDAQEKSAACLSAWQYNHWRVGQFMKSIWYRWIG